MKPVYYLIFLFLVVGCKQQASNNASSDTEKTKPEVKETLQIPSLVKELTTFANITINEKTNLAEVFVVKQIDEEGEITSIDLKSGTTLYKKALSNQSNNRPIFEVINSNNIILMTKSNGYTGAIWSKILVDKSTLEILKVQFDHKGESEGYGADFTLSSFENKFVGNKISFRSKTFGLTQDDKLLVQGEHKIDGISGATITSKAAVEMMNNGLLKYKGYLQK
ncbi:FMN-binding protein [Aquimarina gracilis]|uniref:FMN-binding protein n=1 Tax=Aquimarina gracilis TaxID=874422 RepID=A0ABU5ZWE0_9FLAO|nr:FMN-binding protein [Aquimarina gracilis]MEB3346176.1 FMN-binding protein [Aquimarina gracilis]